MWRLSVFKIINVNCIIPDLTEQVKFLLSLGGFFPHWGFHLTLKWHTLIGPPSKLHLFNSLFDFRAKPGFVLHTLIVLLFLRHRRDRFAPVSCSMLAASSHIQEDRPVSLSLPLSLSVCYSLSHSLTFCSSCSTNPGFPLQTYYPALLYSTSLRLETHTNFKCHHTATHTHTPLLEFLLNQRRRKEAGRNWP